MRIYLPGSARGFIRSHCLQSLFERGHQEALGVHDAEAVLYVAGRSRPQDFIDGRVKAAPIFTQFMNILELNVQLKLPLLLLSSFDVTVNNNPYTALKLSEEALLRAYARCYSFKMLIVRTSCVFGPAMGEERFIPLAAQKILEGEPVTIHSSSGTPSFRAWTWAPALADELIRYIENGNWQLHADDSPSTYYNWKLDALDMAGEIGRALDKPIAYNRLEFYQNNPGHYSGLSDNLWGPPHPAHADLKVALRRTLYSLGLLNA